MIKYSFCCPTLYLKRRRFAFFHPLWYNPAATKPGAALFFAPWRGRRKGGCIIMSSVDTTQITHFFSSLTLAKLPPAIITFIIAYAASRVVLKVADKLFARSRMEKTIEKFLRSALRILMWALIFLIVAGSLGIDVSSMIALLSVASLAVTLAVQGALSNLAGGIMLLSTHPFRVGDFVEVGTVSGTVQEIGMTYTTLVTP